VGVALAASTRHQMAAGIGSSPWWMGSAGWVVASVTAVGAGLLWHWSTRPQLARLALAVPAGVIALEAVAAFAVPTLSAPQSVVLDQVTVRYLQAHAGFGRVYSLGNPLFPNYGSYWDVASLNVNDVPTPALWSAFVHQQLSPRLDPHVFLARPIPAQERAAEELFAGRVSAFRSAGVTLVLTGPGQPLLPALDQLLHPAFHGASAWVYRLAGSAPYAQTYGRCVVQVDSWDTMTTHCLAPGALLRRELWMPGWTATRNGHPVALVRAESYFQAVALPAGSSRFRFAFSPPYEEAGAVAAAVGLALLVLWPLRPRGAARRLRGGGR
ncbi:MAG: hypothetical protein ACYDB7_11925, partial [Mycobacteriales bacterium]